MTDAELVDKARSGDSAAFGELVTRHQAAVIRIARIVCRSREEAEDVAQEAFVTAWKRLDSFRGEAQFRSWLLTIAWRHALSRRESVWRRLRRTVSTDDEGYRETAAPGQAAEDRLSDEALVGDLRRLVRSLPFSCASRCCSRQAGSAHTRRWRTCSAFRAEPSSGASWRRAGG